MHLALKVSEMELLIPPQPSHLQYGTTINSAGREGVCSSLFFIPYMLSISKSFHLNFKKKIFAIHHFSHLTWSSASLTYCHLSPRCLLSCDFLKAATANSLLLKTAPCQNTTSMRSGAQISYSPLYPSVCNRASQRVGAQ